MIEFNGYLTEKSRKFYFRKLVHYIQCAVIFGFVGVFPLVYMLTRYFQSASILYAYGAIFAYVMIMVCLLHIPKINKKTIPKRVYFEDDKMVYITDTDTTSKPIKLAKHIYDYGDFYFIAFPMGNLNGNVVCQKSLLTQGTFEDFEKLFDGKIKRKIKLNKGDK